MQLEGVFCPVVTPFSDSRSEPNLLERNLNKLREARLHGFVLLGSSGETPLLSHSEKVELVKTARQNVQDDEILIVGSGLESTSATIAFTREIADLGADYALVLTPHYYKPQLLAEAYTRHYSQVAEASPIPIILYNVPVFTGIDMPAAAIIDLSGHPNIVGIKDSTNSFAKLSDLINRSSKSFSVLVGNANLFFPGLLAGARGAILALCNIAPQLCVDIYQLFQKKEYERAQDQVTRSLQLVKGVLSNGIPAIKAAMDLLGYVGGLPRSPFLPVDDKIQKEIQKHLKQTELL